MADTTDRSQRWDDIRREQFGSINSLLLTLATGLLAFQASPLIGEQRPTGFTYWATLISIVVLAGSVAAGIFCAWSRLTDARITAQVTRNPANADELRRKADSAGGKSWSRLKWQMGFFGRAPYWWACASCFDNACLVADHTRLLQLLGVRGRAYQATAGTSQKLTFAFHDR